MKDAENSSTEPGPPPPNEGGAQGAAERFVEGLPPRYEEPDPEIPLGKGGIAEVVVSRELRLTRSVALKRLLPNRASTSGECRLRREARVTGLLEHPGIVPIHDIDRDAQDRLFYTMKQVVGRTLREVIERLKPGKDGMTPEEVLERTEVSKEFGSLAARLELFLKVCDAVSFAHEHPLRVIHRDLKPENIMVGGYGEVLVMDWGLAKVLGEGEVAESLREEFVEREVDEASLREETAELTCAGSFLGTPAYAPMEQLEGAWQEVNERSDIYALGGVLYHLLTLDAPLEGQIRETCGLAEEPLGEHVSEDIPSQSRTLTDFGDRDLKASESAGERVRRWCVDQIKSGHTARKLRGSLKSAKKVGVPEALVSVILKALAAEPGNRMGSVRDLARQVRLFQQGFAGDYERAGLWRHLGYFVKRHQSASLTAAVALLVVFAVSTGFTLRVQNQLVETQRQLERSQLEEGRAWLERAKLAWEGENNPQKALIFAGRAVGFLGLGREEADESEYPDLLGRKMTNPDNEAERVYAYEEVRKFVGRVQPTFLPIWSSPVREHHRGGVNIVTFSPDGTRLASASDDKSVKIWDVATGNEVATLDGHSNAVTSVTFSPDGTRLASASDDNSVKLWDVFTGKEIASLEGHLLEVKKVTFSPDGTRLASASRDRTAKLWNMATGKEVATLKGHSDGVEDVSFSPDGTRLASASYDHTVKLWDVVIGKEVATLKGHSSGVTSVTFNRDSTRLASASDDCNVKLWDVATGKEVATLKGHSSGVTSVTFSSDGTRLASASYDNTVKLWEVATGEETATLKGHSSVVDCLTFSRDGTLLASASRDNNVKLWSVVTGTEVATLKGHSDGVEDVSFSPDGTLLATGSRDKSVRLWVVAEVEEVLPLEGHSGSITSVSISPDGIWMASGSEDKMVKIWDVATGKEVATLAGHSDSVTSVSFSPDGMTLASGSEDETVKIWDVTEGKEVAALEGHSDSITSVSFSPDGIWLASGSEDKNVKIWDVIAGEEVAVLEGHSDSIASVSFSPDGMTLASGSEDKSVKIWDVATGKEVATLEGHSDSITSVSFSPDGMTLASGSEDKTVKIWDVTEGKEVATLEGHWHSVTSVSFSPDGIWLASASAGEAVKIWSLAKGDEVAALEGLSSAVTSLTFSPDGTRLASGSDDRTVKLWDVATDDDYLMILEGHLNDVRHMSFSPDGTKLASASLDNTVKLWDTATGKAMATLEGHLSGVECVTFSPDGTRLASGSWDETVKLWDVATGGELATFEGHSGVVTSVTLSSDATRLASGSSDKSVKVWDIPTGDEVSTFLGPLEPVRMVTFSPDGTRLASSTGRSKIYDWEEGTHKLIDVKFGAKSPYTTETLWDVTTGEVINKEIEFPFKIDDKFSRSGKSLVAIAEGKEISVRPTGSVDLPDLYPLVDHKNMRFVGREVEMVPINPSLFRARKFTVKHYRKDDVAALSEPELPLDEVTTLRLRLADRTGQWRAARAWWTAQVVTATPALRNNYLVLLLGCAGDSKATAVESALGELTVEITSNLQTDSIGDPRVSLALSEHILRGAYSERIRPQVWKTFLLKVAECCSRSWQEGVSSRLAYARTITDTSEFTRERLSGAIRHFSSQHPDSPTLLRAAIDTREPADPQRIAEEDRLIALPDAISKDFIEAAYGASLRNAVDRAKGLLTMAEERFPDDAWVHKMVGWSYINLHDHSTALAAFERALGVLEPDEKPSTDLLIGLSIARWLMRQPDSAIAIYKQVIEEDRVQESPVDYSDPQTLSALDYSAVEKKHLEALRAATVAKHPDLKSTTDNTTVTEPDEDAQ